MADRMKLLNEINQVSFMVNDLTLYLDTHPTEKEALECFSEAMKRRKELLKEYATEFEPLTVDCVCPDTNHRMGQNRFSWSDGPLPWEGGTV